MPFYHRIHQPHLTISLSDIELLSIIQRTFHSRDNTCLEHRPMTLRGQTSAHKHKEPFSFRLPSSSFFTTPPHKPSTSSLSTTANPFILVVIMSLPSFGDMTAAQLRAEATGIFSTWFDPSDTQLWASWVDELIIVRVLYVFHSIEYALLTNRAISLIQFNNDPSCNTFHVFHVPTALVVPLTSIRNSSVLTSSAPYVMDISHASIVSTITQFNNAPILLVHMPFLG